MTGKTKSPTAALVRSSAAEYLTFVAASGKGGVEAVYADENVWLSQKTMGLLRRAKHQLPPVDDRHGQRADLHPVH